jgi:hypothetical protein
LIFSLIGRDNRLWPTHLRVEAPSRARHVAGAGSLAKNLSPGFCVGAKKRLVASSGKALEGAKETL